MFFIRFFLKIIIIITLFMYFFLRASDVHAWSVYQNSDFYKVEALCKDVINDLSVMKFDGQASSSWIEQGAYISDQLVALQEAICNLLEHKEEARLHLKEDYDYLYALFERAEEQFKLWDDAYAGNKAQRAIRVCLQRIMQENKKNLKKIMALNREINAYDVDVFDV